MLLGLAIRDIVLIDRLDLAFAPGLSVLTGETGAGKSILLDALGLALGARADAGLLRRGAAQASVTAEFDLPAAPSRRRPSRRAGPRGRRQSSPPPADRRRRPQPRLHQRPARGRRPAAPDRRRAGGDRRPVRAAWPARSRDPWRDAGCPWRPRHRRHRRGLARLAGGQRGARRRRGGDRSGAARRGLSAPCRRGAGRDQARARRGSGARRAAQPDDASRQARRGPGGGAGGSRRPARRRDPARIRRAAASTGSPTRPAGGWIRRSPPSTARRRS